MKKNKEINITIATGIYPPSIGGPASYSKLLYDELPRRGFAVMIVSFDSVRKLPKGISHAVYFIKLFFKSINADIIYVQDPVSVGLPAYVASFLLWKPFVLKVVGDFAWEQGVSRFSVGDTLDDFVIKKSKIFYVRFLQIVESIVARNAKLVIVPSNYLKKIVMTWNVSDKKIKVIYNAFNPPLIEKKTNSENSKKIKIISVGRLVSWKGFIETIEAVCMLHKEGCDISLDIIGSGPQKEVLENLISERNADSFIELLGALPQDILHGKISESDIFVLYTGYEGFSHLILEAMALSVPVLTTKVGGNVEIIKSDYNGILVEYNHNIEELKLAIEQLSLDSDKKSNIINNAQKTINGFSEEKMLGELERTLKGLL